MKMWKWSVVCAVLAGCGAVSAVGNDETERDAVCKYFESCRLADGGYAYPEQDASHLTVTYAAVMAYAALGRDVPGDKAALAKLIAGPLFPLAASRTRWHWNPLCEFNLQQARAVKALGGYLRPYSRMADAKKNIDSYLASLEQGGNPILTQQMAVLLLKAECGCTITPEVRKVFSDYLDARERTNGTYNTTLASDGSDGHVVNTAYALAGRRVLGVQPDRKVVGWIQSCQRPDGGFTWAPNPEKGGVSDLWYAHAAVRALLDLGARPKDEAALLGWLGSLRNADGGFAPRPGLRSDPLATWRAVDLLVRLGRPLPPRNPAMPKHSVGNLSGLRAFTIQFEAPGTGSAREAVQVAKDLKIHLWGAKNATPKWLAAAQAEADRRGVPVTFFASNENYDEWREVPGIGKFSHLRDPAYPPKGAKGMRPFELWQICDHECCARVWLDSGEYDGIGTFHFWCYDMTWLLPFLYQYEETIPFVANQDAHNEAWWGRDDLMAFRTVFLAKEGTWDAFRDACAKGLVTSVREDAHTQGRLRMIGGRPEAKARIRELEGDWRVRELGERVSVQVLTPEDVFERAHPKVGRVIRVRVDYHWRGGEGISNPSCRLATAREGGKELAIDRRVFRHEQGWMRGKIDEAYDLVPLADGATEPVTLRFDPLDPEKGPAPFERIVNL